MRCPSVTIILAMVLSPFATGNEVSDPTVLLQRRINVDQGLESDVGESAQNDAVEIVSADASSSEVMKTAGVANATVTVAEFKPVEKGLANTKTAVVNAPVLNDSGRDEKIEAGSTLEIAEGSTQNENEEVDSILESADEEEGEADDSSESEEHEQEEDEEDQKDGVPAPPPAPPATKGGLKEEVFYHIHNMRKLPDVRRRRPSSVREVPQPYYRNQGGKWPGFSQRDNFAVRWTGTLNIKTAGHYTFWTYSDDGSRMWLDGSAVVNNDGCHGWRAKTGRKQVTAGKHAFKAEMFENGGGAGMEVLYQGSDTNNRRARIPSSAFSPGGPAPTPAPPATKAGLKEEVFYNIRNMRKLPDVRRRRPSIVREVSQPYYRNTGGKWPGFSQRDNFAVRWTGTLNINTAGQYTFTTYSDDGSRMWLDGSAVVNNDGCHGWRAKTGRKQVSTGKHEFRAEMFENGGGAGMEVLYQGSDTSNRRMRIPSSAFSPAGPAPTPAPTTPAPTTKPPATTPAPTTVCGPERGLKQEVYYNIKNMRHLPKFGNRKASSTRTVAEPYYKNTGNPWPTFSQRDDYAVRWTGGLNIKKEGYYHFETYSDDGSKMWIDNSEVVNNDGLHGWQGKSGPMLMAPGAHLFKTEMFEKGGGQGIEVKYKGPDTNDQMQRIPSSAFSCGD